MRNPIVPPRQPQETQTFADNQNHEPDIGASDPNPRAYKNSPALARSMDSARCASSRANRRSNRDQQRGEDEQCPLQHGALADS
jgi:hypothetical protein